MNTIDTEKENKEPQEEHNKNIAKIHGIRPGERLVETYNPHDLKAIFGFESLDTIDHLTVYCGCPVLFFAHLEHKTRYGTESRIVGIVAKEGVEIAEDCPDFTCYSDQYPHSRTPGSSFWERYSNASPEKVDQK